MAELLNGNPSQAFISAYQQAAGAPQQPQDVPTVPSQLTGAPAQPGNAAMGSTDTGADISNIVNMVSQAMGKLRQGQKDDAVTRAIKMNTKAATMPKGFWPTFAQGMLDVAQAQNAGLRGGSAADAYSKIKANRLAAAEKAAQLQMQQDQLEIQRGNEIQQIIKTAMEEGSRRRKLKLERQKAQETKRHNLKTEAKDAQTFRLNTEKARAASLNNALDVYKGTVDPATMAKIASRSYNEVMSQGIDDPKKAQQIVHAQAAELAGHHELAAALRKGPWTYIRPEGSPGPKRGTSFDGVHDEMGNVLPPGFTLTTQQIQGTPEQFGKVPATLADRIRGQGQDALRGKEVTQQIIDAIKARRSRAGLPGSAKRLFQEGVGVLADVDKAIGTDLSGFVKDVVRQEIKDAQLGRADPALGDLFDPSLPEMDMAANAIAYWLARAHKDEGRLNRDDVNVWRSQIKLTGLKSIDSILQSLEYIKNTFDRAHRDAFKRYQELTTGEFPQEGKTKRYRYDPESGMLVPQQ